MMFRKLLEVLVQDKKYKRRPDSEALIAEIDARCPRKPSDKPKTELEKSMTVNLTRREATSEIAEVIQNDIKSRNKIAAKSTPILVDIVMEAFQRGGDLYLLVQAIRHLMPDYSEDCSELARNLLRAPRLFIAEQNLVKAGLTKAIWQYSRSPCGGYNPGNPVDLKHQALDGIEFDIVEGVLVDGKWIKPQSEDGCHCLMKTIIPGVSR